MEMSNEQLYSQISKSNVVIRKLQAQVGKLSGAVALLETERDSYLTHAQNLENKIKKMEENQESKVSDKAEVSE